jgi:radical SAM superfamily enzyme YgiQ (UPF0313 family)
VLPVNAEPTSAGEVVRAILEEARATSPADVDVAFGAYVWNEALLQGVLPLLRARGFAGRIVLGGPQISYAGRGLEGIYPQADVFVRGYGEAALCALARDPSNLAIPGVHHAGGEDRCAQAEVRLDDLPSPWLDGLVPARGQPFLRWETKRGCPFRCSFCQHREPGARLRRRSLSATRVTREIDLFCEAGVREIAVLDPIFNQGAEATAVLERFVNRGYRGRLSLQCRAELVDEPFLDAAEQLDVCLEFGLQTIHQSEGDAVLRRNQVARVDAVLAEVGRRRIDHEVSLIFGLPEQTLASFKESVEFCLARRVPRIKAFPLLLLRGTALDDERDRWGFVDAGGAMPMAVESRSFSRADWEIMARISEALRRTEGAHPGTMSELLDRAADSRVDIARWQPQAEGTGA